MSLSEHKREIEIIWNEYRSGENPYPDILLDLVGKMIELDPFLVSWAIDEFTRETDEILKENLAQMIVFSTPYTPAIEWLRDNTDWTKEDFAEADINIDDYGAKFQPSV
ncbi:MAG: hypothetical protein H6624_09590 [Bdellovibrionaceae bacterium]|nr:hypothetical protein [Bdellovibrionales bacterium]MCB9084588.1 hypothetical protein [Pseudobdellovibrionaceae bacterium]